MIQRTQKWPTYNALCPETIKTGLLVKKRKIEGDKKKEN